MSDKIERLYEKRYAALIEKIEASFVKNNAEQEYLEKVKIFDEIEEQLYKALREEAENDPRN